MYVDTNIIVDLLRNEPKAKIFFENYTGCIRTSIIVKLELIDGLKTKHEIPNLNKRVIRAFQIDVIQISDEVSKAAEKIFIDFRHSHGVSVNGSIIAATSLSASEPLATHNTQNFEFIPGF